MGPNWTRGRGRRPLALSYSLSLSLFPSLLLHTLGARLGGRPLSLPPLYTWARGTPKTHKFLLTVCGAPSTVTHLDHTIVVLRQSPASETSSSLSPRHRADKTLPQPQLDQEFKGRHRAECVQIAEVSCVRSLDQLDREDVRLHQPRY